jgi:hypothetical protein
VSLGNSSAGLNLGMKVCQDFWVGPTIRPQSIFLRPTTTTTSILSLRQLRQLQTYIIANMSDNGEVEVEVPSNTYPVLPKDVTSEIGAVKLFNKWSYEDVEIRDISLTYVQNGKEEKN